MEKTYRWDRVSLTHTAVCLEARQFAKHALPSLDKSPAYWRMLEYILWGTWIDDETEKLVLSRDLIRKIEGEKDTAFYSAEKFLESFSRDVFSIKWSDSASSINRARTLISADTPSAMETIVEWEQGRKHKHKEGVFFSTGQPFTQRVQNKQRLDQQQEALKEMAKARVPEARRLLNYLNNLPPRTFYNILKNMPEAQNKARKLDKDSSRQLNLLKTISDYYQPFYAPVSKSDRLYAINPSILSLQRDVRIALTKGWVEFDLQNAQLAIVATMWDIPELKDYLSRGNSIWPYLIKNLNLSSKDKPILKDAIYPIVFGSSKKNVELKLSQLGGHIPTKFFELPLIQELWKKRRKEIQKIYACGGGDTVFGVWLPIIGRDKKERYRSVCSILSQQCQAIELKLLFPVIGLAEKYQDNNHGYLITVWQHDGFSVYFKDKKMIKKLSQELINAVGKQAKKLGTHTKLEASPALTDLAGQASYSWLKKRAEEKRREKGGLSIDILG